MPHILLRSASVSTEASSLKFSKLIIQVYEEGQVSIFAGTLNHLPFLQKPICDIVFCVMSFCFRRFKYSLLYVVFSVCVQCCTF